MAEKPIDVFDNFYEGKKILITGHTGFKGSWLSLWLHELGAKVIGYSLESLQPESHFQSIGLKEKIVDLRGDIRDFPTFKKVLANYKPDIIFHLAAQPLVRESYEKPYETYMTNIVGTLNVLEAMREVASVKVGIMITTDKCYENKEQIWPYRECDPMGGKDPYSSSKGCCELMIASYNSSFFQRKSAEQGPAVASVRAGNVIGGGDWAIDRIVPDCIRKLKCHEPIYIRNPQAVRPWQFVLEPLYGYLLLAKKIWEEGIKDTEGWNFGPTEEGVAAVHEVVAHVLHAWGDGKWVHTPQDDTKEEATLLLLDSTKARRKLGWHTHLTLEESIELTVQWYKKATEANYQLSYEQLIGYSQKLKNGGR